MCLSVCMMHTFVSLTQIVFEIESNLHCSNRSHIKFSCSLRSSDGGRSRGQAATRGTSQQPPALPATTPWPRSGDN